MCPEDGHLMGTFSSCDKQPSTSCNTVSGFKARQGEAAEMVTDKVQSPGCLQRTLFIRHESWMEMFTLEGVSITPASFVLNFKSMQLGETEEPPSGVSHGVLCLFLFNTKEYVYHWYDTCHCFVLSTA